jgi:polyphenol oxidase
MRKVSLAVSATSVYCGLEMFCHSSQPCYTAQMLQVEHGALRFLQFKSFDPAIVAHGIFTRHGGLSPEPYASLNMSVSTGDARDNVRANVGKALAALERDPASCADLWQVHSDRVVVADEPNGSREHLGQADALITDRPEVSLLLRFADCIPILLYDRRRPAVGVVHAGWRGTLKKVAKAAVEAMAERYGSRPADLVAGIGPGIGPCHYAIGPEVVDQTRQAFNGVADSLLLARNGGYYLDLWAANCACMREAGVEQIEVAEICTVCQSEDFFSHRATGGLTGRFGSLIGLQ